MGTAGSTSRWEPSKLTVVYIAALALIAGLLIASQIAVQTMLLHQQTDARTINLAGRQRMLSQKITKQAISAEHAGSLRELRERTTHLTADVAKWRATHLGMQNGDVSLGLAASKGPELSRLFTEIEPHFLAMATAASEVADIAGSSEEIPAPIEELVATITGHEGRFLHLMNEIVFAIDREAKTRVVELQQVEASFALAALCLLALLGFLVFRPAVSRVRDSMSELMTARKNAERLARLDGLTGVANRRHFNIEIKRECRRAARESQAVSMVMIDLDDFKRLNDNEGHLAGDACLVKIAQTLSSEMRRPGDLVARFGGDEFVVFLPNTDHQGAERVAARLKTRVRELEISAGNGDRFVGMSAGTASARPTSPEFSPAELIEAADRALYREKDQRRPQLRVLGDDSEAPARA